MKIFESVFEGEPPLTEIDKIEQGKPASFFVYHGSGRPFITAVPSEKFPVVFYADSPEVAATYPWGKYLNELQKKAIELSENIEVLIAAKILNTEAQKRNPKLEGLASPGYTLVENHFKDPIVIKVMEKLQADPEFRAQAEKVLLSWNMSWNAQTTKEKEVVEYETGPVGSVREYSISAKNPAVFDFEGHTWGDLKDENGEWSKPTRSATTEALRNEWGKWVDGFFKDTTC